jgi:hypothetical protein
MPLLGTMRAHRPGTSAMQPIGHSVVPLSQDSVDPEHTQVRSASGGIGMLLPPQKPPAQVCGDGHSVLSEHGTPLGGLGRKHPASAAHAINQRIDVDRTSFETRIGDS